jgi:hypothetical protein
VFQVAAPQIRVDAFQHDRWVLPGLTVRVETNMGELAVTRDGDLAELRYSAPSSPAGAPIHFTIETEPA